MRKTNLSSRETELRMPLNLQFFAEDDSAGADDSTNPEVVTHSLCTYPI